MRSKIFLNCKICGEGFKPWHGREETSKYCSKNCCYKGLRTLEDRKCLHCDRIYHPQNSKKLFCSPKCYLESEHRRKTLKMMADSRRGKPNLKLRGRKFTPKTLNRMRLANLGKKRGHHSEETRRSISKALRKRYRIDKKSNANLGRHHSEEWNKKIGLGNTGKLSPKKGKTYEEIYEEKGRVREIKKKMAEGISKTLKRLYR